MDPWRSLRGGGDDLDDLSTKRCTTVDFIIFKSNEEDE